MLYRRSVLVVLLALIFLSFFVTLGLSAWMFPQNYDWRYRVISNLLSPRDNPLHHWLPACGIAFAAMLMLPFAGARGKAAREAYSRRVCFGPGLQ